MNLFSFFQRWELRCLMVNHQPYIYVRAGLNRLIKSRRYVDIQYLFESEKLNLMLEVIYHSELQTKTFVFQREETQQSLIVDCQLDLTDNFINLNNLLQRHCAPELHRISIYDPNSNAFASLNKIGADNGFIHKQYLEPRVILIRYKRRHTFGTDSDSVDSSLDHDSSSERKEGRSKERTIAETIELVKRWRNLHLHGHNTLRRRLNLQDAAKVLGVSKKSLDDYYCQLRLGEFYGFDFGSNLHEKMGVLRNYVKHHKQSPSQKSRNRRQNQKHPKNLRVIERFEIDTKTLLPEFEEEEEMDREESVQEIPRLSKTPSRHESPLLQQRYEEIEQDSLQFFRELSSIQHEFFQGFQLALDFKRDPYQEIERDFSRKGWEQSNSFLYFDN